jgi:tRNA (guanine-N7-)-methyltransferase
MMERPPRPQINVTTDLPVQNAYTLALNNEFNDFAFDETRAPQNRGRWRKVLKLSDSAPLDVEFGTGNGLFFSHRATQNPNRGLIGLELKYKPLVQSIRRALRAGAKNAAITRFHAFNADQLFEQNEINDVFIHFPDPWTSPLKPKNRMTNAWFLDLIFELQKPGSFLNFKTDSEALFDWTLEEIPKTKYKMIFQTRDLHNSEMASQNFITGFEKIFTAQGIKTHFLRLQKN